MQVLGRNIRRQQAECNTAAGEEMHFVSLCLCPYSVDISIGKSAQQTHVAADKQLTMTRQPTISVMAL